MRLELQGELGPLAREKVLALNPTLTTTPTHMLTCTSQFLASTSIIVRLTFFGYMEMQVRVHGKRLTEFQALGLGMLELQALLLRLWGRRRCRQSGPTVGTPAAVATATRAVAPTAGLRVPPALALALRLAVLEKDCVAD